MKQYPEIELTSLYLLDEDLNEVGLASSVTELNSGEIVLAQPFSQSKAFCVGDKINLRIHRIRCDDTVPFKTVSMDDKVLTYFVEKGDMEFKDGSYFAKELVLGAVSEIIPEPTVELGKKETTQKRRL